jgi:hypothetical protein
MSKHLLCDWQLADRRIKSNRRSHIEVTGLLGATFCITEKSKELRSDKFQHKCPMRINKIVITGSINQSATAAHTNNKTFLMSHAQGSLHS